MGVRTFLAVDLTAEVRAALAAAQRGLDAAGARIKWVADDNRHVTVKFLGDVADGQLAAVCEAAAAAARGARPFEFAVRGLLLVPPRGRQVRIIWAGVDDPSGRMAALYARVEAAIGELGFAPEGRAFRPHVTVARIKSVGDATRLRRSAEPLAEQDFGTVAAAALVAYSSKLTRGGPVYAPMATAPLGG
jgi:2'-5' RNA ligase